MAIKAVIFDLDGTITRPILDFDAIREEIGLARDAGPLLELMEEMTSDRRLRAERVLEAHERRAVEQSSLNDAARETLEALRSAGIKVGVLTRNKRANVLCIAQKHNLTFDGIVDREDGPVKPDAYGVLRLCEQFAAGRRKQWWLVITFTTF